MNGAAQVWKQTYSYDRFGNRMFESTNTTLPQITPQNEASTNPSISQIDNRISAAGYRYDLVGNLECDPGHPCGSASPYPPYYEYDAENRIKTANGGASSGGSNYAYDGDGRRVKKVVGGAGTATTVFVYNVAGQLVAEYSTQQQSMGGTSYLTVDDIGTPRVITKADGSVIGRHDYLPFGEEIAASYGGRSGVPGYAAIDDLKQQFTQKERDIETGLDYFGARYYSSTQGRFTSADEPFAINLLVIRKAGIFIPTSETTRCALRIPTAEFWMVTSSRSSGTSWRASGSKRIRRSRLKRTDVGVRSVILPTKRILLAPFNSLIPTLESKPPTV
jgi:RHS repeat-associated protein